MSLPTVVTIAREMGSGGSYIGQQVARRLGYAYIDREILQHAAKELGCEERELEGRDERLQTFWDKLISVFAVGAPEGLYAPPPRWISDERLIKTERRLIRELAARGPCVVIGHGAFHLLYGRAKLLNVFVHAPVSFRIQRVMSIYGAVNEEEAAEMIDRADQERDRYIQFFTGFHQFDARNYHITIDTGFVSFTKAEEMIASLVLSMREEGDWPWVKEPN